MPIKGAPAQDIRKGNRVTRVAVLGHDYPNMKPRMEVKEGDTVKRGQLLFEDRKAEGVRFTAPGAGKVVAINRGERRAFQSLVIELSTSELAGKESAVEHETFKSFNKNLLHSGDNEKIRELLGESGMWTALRSRPFCRVPSIHDKCDALFITATDTNPHAPSVAKVMEGQEEVFKDGVRVLSKLTEGPTYVCVGPDWSVNVDNIKGVTLETFQGKHPAGLPGTHIHVLAPASRKRTVFYINYQDVVAVGHLFREGTLRVDRVISIAGPTVKDPHLVKTRWGANTQELTKGKLEDVENRIISGSVLFGHNATEDAFSYLNRYDSQVSALQEGRHREFMGWLRPGGDRFSTVRAYVSSWIPFKKKLFNFTTNTMGSHRAMVPIGMF